MGSASLRLIQQLGASRIEKHIYKLTDYLISSLRTLGVRLVTPAARKYRSGIVTFCVGSAAANMVLMEQLLEHRILVSVRYTSQVGGVRVSCHFYNNIDDVDRLLENVEAALRSSPQAARHYRWPAQS